MRNEWVKVKDFERLQKKWTAQLLSVISLSPDNDASNYPEPRSRPTLTAEYRDHALAERRWSAVMSNVVEC